MDETKDKSNALLSAVNKAKTPTNIFAIAMMACASVLGGSATLVESCESLTAFTYTIHAFLAVSGMFFLSLLFCRKGIYHPQDLDTVSPEVRSELGVDRPITAAVLIVIVMLAYGGYQYTTPNPCLVDNSQHSDEIQKSQENESSK